LNTWLLLVVLVEEPVFSIFQMVAEEVLVVLELERVLP
jgi:hypothetical protein